MYPIFFWTVAIAAGGLSSWMAIHSSENNFYATYEGHDESQLRGVVAGLKEMYPARRFVYLIGDSSLDNKYWISEWGEPEPGFPSPAKKDVTFFLNKELSVYEMVAINCAVEGSSVGSFDESPPAQHAVMRDFITERDVVVVSIGANDIALRADELTLLSLVQLKAWGTVEALVADPSGVPGFLRLKNIFLDGVERYIKGALGDKRPHKVVVCMIYYPDATNPPGWASEFLRLMDYDSNPELFRAIIDALYRESTIHVMTNSEHMSYFAMSQILDGSDPADYESGVEPSVKGGAKLARALALTI